MLLSLKSLRKCDNVDRETVLDNSAKIPGVLETFQFTQNTPSGEETSATSYSVGVGEDDYLRIFLNQDPYPKSFSKQKSRGFRVIRAVA